MVRHWLLATFALLLMLSPATAERRLALVVGNDDYESLGDLKRARADADAVGAALTALGFEVVVEKDATRRAMNRSLSDLEARIAPGDTVFFFFAGHGVAIAGENVLLPVDLPKPGAGEESLVREEGVVVDGIVDRIQRRGASTTFLVLDACRDNPFAAAGTRSIGQNRGLTRIETPKGVFVLYSAGLGQSALDQLPKNDTDKNSVFTRNLVPLLGEPGLTHVDLAKRVQSAVDKLASSVGHAQQPAYYDQIVGEYVLNTTPKPADANAVLAEAAALWPGIEASTDKAAIEAFIAKYGATAFGELARKRLASLDAPAPAVEVAAVAPAVELAPLPTEAAPAEDPKLVARELQQVLMDKGCYRGTVDGDWGKRSAGAVEQFNAAASLDLDAARPTTTTVEVVKASSVACPVAVEVAEPVSSAAGVKKSAAPRKASKAKVARKPAATRRAARRASRRSTSQKKSSGNCFTFNGELVCD